MIMIPVCNSSNDYDCMFVGMKLIMDFIPNHVSSQHDWFQLSKKDKVRIQPLF